MQSFKDFYIIIEATRRGFLKQIGGALATAVAPMPAAKAVTNTVATSIHGYEISAFSLSGVISDMWQAHNKTYTEEQLLAAVSKLSKTLESGRLPKSRELIQRLLYEPLGTEVSEMLSARGKQTANDSYEDASNSNSWAFDDWFNNWCDGANIMDDLETAYDAVAQLAIPKDITYKGRVVMKAADAIKNNILCSQSDVIDNIDSTMNDFNDYADEVQADAEHANHEADVENAKDTIKDTHSQLGIRRDSAWYESVLKEQDNSKLLSNSPK